MALIFDSVNNRIGSTANTVGIAAPTSAAEALVITGYDSSDAIVRQTVNRNGFAYSRIDNTHASGSMILDMRAGSAGRGYLLLNSVGSTHDFEINAAGTTGQNLLLRSNSSGKTRVLNGGFEVADGKSTFFTPTTSAASINLPHGTAPSAPADGDGWTTTAGTFVRVNGGTVEIGFRNIPRSTTTTTAAIGDRGRCIAVTGNIDIPASVFAAGDAISIYNNSGSSVSVTQGSGLTMYLVGTATTGNRTLAQRGLVTIWFNTATECVISGGGLS